MEKREEEHYVKAIHQSAARAAVARSVPHHYAVRLFLSNLFHKFAT